MSDPHSAYALQIILESFGALADAVTPEHWSAPTPCETWDVRALVNHLAMGNLLFAAALRELPVPDFADYLSGDPAGELRRSSEELLNAFDIPAVMSKTVKVPFGDVPGSIAMNLRMAETLVHGWDLAMATGQQTAFPEELAGTALVFTRNAIGAVPRGQQFADEKPVAADAPALDQLAALLGRSV